MKQFARPVRWLGIGFLAAGALVLVTMVLAQIDTPDPEAAIGFVTPAIFIAAGSGLLRVAHRMRTNPTFEIVGRHATSTLSWDSKYSL